MKEKIHPNYGECTVTCACGNAMETSSTKGDYRVDEEGRFYNRWGEEISTAPPLPRGGPEELIEHNRDLAIDAHGRHREIAQAAVTAAVISA